MIYCFECERCNIGFEHRCTMSESHLIPECPGCGRTRYVHRDYQSEGVHLSPPIKTLGSQAEKNASKMSEDQRQSIKHKNELYKKSNNNMS